MRSTRRTAYEEYKFNLIETDMIHLLMLLAIKLSVHLIRSCLLYRAINPEDSQFKTVLVLNSISDLLVAFTACFNSPRNGIHLLTVSKLFHT